MGDDVGNKDGNFDGNAVGVNVGSSEGIAVGAVVGNIEGVFEGNCVGIELGNWLDCASAPVIISGKKYKLTAAENIIHFFLFVQRLSTLGFLCF